MSAALLPHTGPDLAARLEGPPDPESYGEVEIDAAGAAEWAKVNRIATAGPGGVVARINAARFAAKLPTFRIVKARHAPPPARPVPAVIARAAVVVVAPTPFAPAATLPLATQDDLLRAVTEFSGTITTLVDQDLAGWVHAINTGNRPVTRANVDRFKGLLRDGKWINTGEPVIVSRDVILNDGQHRLLAILETGIPAELDIRFGIARSAFAATNTGAKRTAGNVLAIAGKPHASTQAAIARLLHHYEAGTMASCNQVVEPHRVVEIANQERHLADVAARQRGYRFAPARLAPLGLILTVASRHAPLDRVFAFADLVASGAEPDESNPARRLHVRLRDAAIGKERLHQVEVAALAARAWNAWVEGRKLTLLKATEQDRSSAGFPRVAAP